MQKTILAVFLCLAAFQLKSQPLEFYQESLNFTLDTGKFTVSGMYFISNTGKKELTTTIYYPYVYPTGNIDTISVYNCNTMEYMPVFAGQKGHWFKLFVPEIDTVVLHIKYSHKHNDSLATYILTTTKYWKKPFQVADYTLRAARELKVNDLFEKPDTSWADSFYRYYYWMRHQYMPKKDFTVKFEK
jgi:hypothetical protein